MSAHHCPVDVIGYMLTKGTPILVFKSLEDCVNTLSRYGHVGFLSCAILECRNLYRLKGELASHMFTLARDLNLVTSRILTGLTAILLAGHNVARARDVGAPGFLSIFHSQFSPSEFRSPSGRRNPYPSMSACKFPNVTIP
jgi:hypothetical protein